ncbi:hypothetical protein EV127DRAFT_438127 [Xylaria flabelliformis]|nr:hypothetical protein EV127DRAFT_438127 [Xylaria flabelliformis]KAI0863868.1 hypothetical protein F4860DRAFT_20808 [Xylaria cubensis]
MTYITSVVYEKGVTFDMDYYLASHMPLVQKLWGPYGLKSWKVVHYTSPDAPYAVQAWLEWESKEAADKGFPSSDGATIFADVSKFSDKPATAITGELVGSASW